MMRGEKGIAMNLEQLDILLNLFVQSFNMRYKDEILMKRAATMDDVFHITLLQMMWFDALESLDPLIEVMGYEPVGGRITQSLHPEGKYSLYLSTGNRRCKGSTIAYGHHEIEGGEPRPERKHVNNIASLLLELQYVGVYNKAVPLTIVEKGVTLYTGLFEDVPADYLSKACTLTITDNGDLIFEII